MEPKPHYTAPEWDTLEELDLNPEPSPEPRPKGRFFYKLALISLVLVFLAGIILPNISWLKTKSPSDRHPEKYLWSVTKIAKDPESKVFYAPNEESFIILNPANDNLDLYKLSSGSYLYSIATDHTAINDLTYAPDGKAFAMALDTGDISIHTTLTGVELKILSHTAKPKHIAWSPDSTRLAAVYDNEELLLWDLNANKNALLAEEAFDVPKWSPNGRYLDLSPEEGSMNPHGTMRLFDTHTLTELFYPIEPAAYYQPPHFMKQSNKILYGVSFAGQIVEWDLETNRSYTFDPDESWLGKSSISPDERMLYSILYGDGDLKIWDLETKTHIATLDYDEQANVSYNLSWSPDSKHIVVAYDTGVDFHSAETGAFESRIKLDPRSNHMYHGFSPDGQLILTTDGNSFSLWSPQTSAQLHKVAGPYGANKVFWFQNSSQLVIQRQDAIDIYRISDEPGGPAFDISANPPMLKPSF